MPSIKQGSLGPIHYSSDLIESVKIIKLQNVDLEVHSNTVVFSINQ